MAKQNNLSPKDAEAVLVKAIRGQYAKGMELTKAQLQAMVRTNPEIALGLGITVGASGVVEGVTEAAQESLSVLASGGKLNWEDPEYRNRILNALAAGGVLGGGFGALESGTIADINLKSGLADATAARQNELSTSLDYDDPNLRRELSAQEAFEWVEQNVPDDKYEDKYAGLSASQRAAQEFDQEDGFIDRTLHRSRGLYAAQVEQELRGFQGRGVFVDRFISPFLGNRGGATVEKERQLLYGQVADKAEFSEKVALGKLGFRTNQEFAEYHYNKARHDFVNPIIGRATRSGKRVADILTESEIRQHGLTPEYIKFLDQVATSNRKGNTINYGDPAGPEFDDGFNILERGFSPQEIYQNQGEFVDDLVRLRGLPRTEAERLATVLTNTETVVDPDTLYDEIGDPGSDNTRFKKAVKDLKQDARFSKYLEANPFNNIAQNGIKFSAQHTNNKYFGVGGQKVADAISKAVKAGEITADESIKLARFFRDYQQQLSGTYNVITNRAYNRAMNFGTTYASLNLLELAAISSWPEIATTLLHNRQSSGIMKDVAEMANKAGSELRNSLRELSRDATAGHISSKEYGNNREKLRELGFLSEQTAPAARVGAEYSPNQARIMQMFFNAIQLNSVTNFTRGFALSKAQDAINGYVAEAAMHYPGPGEAPNRFYNRAVRELDELGMPGQQIALMAYHANVTKDGGEPLKAKLAEFMDIATLNFMDQRIMTPRKGNRAKWLNDPRFRIVATFSGYISTVTTTLLPKIYSNLGGKDRLPTERVNAVATMAMMLAMAALAINMKGFLRGREEDEDKDAKDYFRILSQSGLLGLADRPLQVAFPISNPRTQIGDTLGNVNQNLGDFANLFIGQAPIIENIDQGLLSSAASAIDPKDDNALRNLIGAVPILDVFAKQRLTPYQLQER